MGSSATAPRAARLAQTVPTCAIGSLARIRDRGSRKKTLRPYSRSAVRLSARASSMAIISRLMSIGFIR